MNIIIHIGLYIVIGMLGYRLGFLFKKHIDRTDDWRRLTKQMNARKEFDRANLYKKLTMENPDLSTKH